jgi:glutaredoxin-like protein
MQITIQDLNYLKQRLKEVKDEVKILFFKSSNCNFCKETREILNFLSNLSPLIKIEEYDIKSKEAKENKINLVPAIVLLNKNVKGKIRYFGIPTGYEFFAFLETLIAISKKENELSEQGKKEIRKINKKVHIKVFVTPVCPYCAGMVKLANYFAMENENIISDTIEVTEFPDLAEKYQVVSVPKVVINEFVEIVGAVSESFFLYHLKNAI